MSPEHFGLEVSLMYLITGHTFSFALFELTPDCFSHLKTIVKAEAQTCQNFWAGGL
jgi:hypothetical protein